MRRLINEKRGVIIRKSLHCTAHTYVPFRRDQGRTHASTDVIDRHFVRFAMKRDLVPQSAKIEQRVVVHGRHITDQCIGFLRLLPGIHAVDTGDKRQRN